MGGPHPGNESHDAVVCGSAMQGFHHITHRRVLGQQKARHRIFRGLLLEPAREVHFEDSPCWHCAFVGPGQSAQPQHDDYE
jgi:hypothetical protein